MPSEWYSDALAFFITFHTYGTWLHGRSEGSVDRQHNSPQSPFLDKDAEREWNEWNRLKAQPFNLDAYQRYIIEATIHEVCSYRGWSLHAMNVRTNHVTLKSGHVMAVQGISGRRMLLLQLASMSEKDKVVSYRALHRPI